MPKLPSTVIRGRKSHLQKCDAAQGGRPPLGAAKAYEREHLDHTSDTNLLCGQKSPNSISTANGLAATVILGEAVPNHDTHRQPHSNQTLSSTPRRRRRRAWITPVGTNTPMSAANQPLYTMKAGLTYAVREVRGGLSRGACFFFHLSSMTMAGRAELYHSSALVGVLKLRQRGSSLAFLHPKRRLGRASQSITNTRPAKPAENHARLYEDRILHAPSGPWRVPRDRRVHRPPMGHRS